MKGPPLRPERAGLGTAQGGEAAAHPPGPLHPPLDLSARAADVLLERLPMQSTSVSPPPWSSAGQAPGPETACQLLAPSGAGPGPALCVPGGRCHAGVLPPQRVGEGLGCAGCRGVLVKGAAPGAVGC